MSEQKPISAANKDRSLGFLIGLLIGTRWALYFLLVTVPLTAAGVSFLPLRVGGDGAADDGFEIHLGAAFEDGMSQDAIYVQAIVAVITLAFGVYAIGQMLGVLRNVRAGNSFVRDNGDRLRRIGYAGIATQLCVYAVWIGAVIVEAAGLAVLEGMRMEINFAPWIGILMTFALATVFRDGAALKEEQDLTV